MNRDLTRFHIKDSRSPYDIWLTLESAHTQGLIGCWHYQWLHFLRKVHSWTRHDN